MSLRVCDLLEQFTHTDEPLPFTVACAHGEWCGSEPGNARWEAVRYHLDQDLAAVAPSLDASSTVRVTNLGRAQ